MYACEKDKIMSFPFNIYTKSLLIYINIFFFVEINISKPQQILHACSCKEHAFSLSV